MIRSVLYSGRWGDRIEVVAVISSQGREGQEGQGGGIIHTLIILHSKQLFLFHWINKRRVQLNIVIVDFFY